MTRLTGRLAIASVALGLLVAGCGTASYSRPKLDRLITTRLDQHRGFDVQSVACPAHAKVAQGVAIRCTATLRGGHVVGLRATQLDDKGTVHLVANEMFADNVERSVVLTLGERGVRATAVCPEHVPVVLGRMFGCSVRDASGDHGRVAVTIVDSDGGFRLSFN